MSRECPSGCHSGNTLGTLFGHSGARGPKGPRDTPRDTPGTLRARRVRETPVAGPYPQYGWDFPEEIPERLRKDPGNALRAFPGSFPSRVRLGCPKPCNSRHLRLPEHFQNLSPPVRLGAFLFSEVGEGLPDPKGPKIEKNQSRLKFSISIENFNLA